MCCNSRQALSLRDELFDLGIKLVFHDNVDDACLSNFDFDDAADDDDDAADDAADDE